MQAPSKSVALAAVVAMVLVGSVVAVRGGGGLGDRRVRASEGERTHFVARVIDGDTLELGDGRTVRLVGIDAPEREECGYDRASAALADLVLRRRVRLAASDEDTDHYGRLLRYVDVGTTDAGLRLIERGLAVARYDSRDGNGHHPRERSTSRLTQRPPSWAVGSDPNRRPLAQRESAE